MDTQSPVFSPGPNGSPARSRVALAFFWGLFAIMVLAGGWQFLRACGTTSLLGFGRDFCPSPSDDGALRHEVDVGEGLRRQIHLAELQVAETPLCVPPPPPVAPYRQQTGQIDRDVERKGGKKGKLQFTLVWHTKDDLDLDLDCPGGRISSFPNQKGPGICGDGVKDLDANRNATDAATTDPVENITFAGTIPDGTYAISVIEYIAYDKTRRSSVPFTLQIRSNDQVKICQGNVTWIPRAMAQRDAVGVISGVYQTITLTYGQDMQNCDFVPAKGHIIGPQKQ